MVRTNKELTSKWRAAREENQEEEKIQKVCRITVEKLFLIWSGLGQKWIPFPEWSYHAESEGKSEKMSLPCCFCFVVGQAAHSAPPPHPCKLSGICGFSMTLFRHCFYFVLLISIRFFFAYIVHPVLRSLGLRLRPPDAVRREIFVLVVGNTVLLSAGALQHGAVTYDSTRAEG